MHHEIQKLIKIIKNSFIFEGETYLRVKLAVFDVSLTQKSIFHILGVKNRLFEWFWGYLGSRDPKKPKNRIFWEKVRKLRGKWSGILFISILDRLEPIPTHPPHFFDFFSKNPIFDPLRVTFGHMGFRKISISSKIWILNKGRKHRYYCIKS